MMLSFLLVALGGALGAVLRYSIGLLPIQGEFPVLTLGINFLGAVAIGFVAAAGNQIFSEKSVLFWKTGVCGGFTTFSTFSLEAVELFRKGRYIPGGAYVLLSVVGCLFGVLLGRQLYGIFFGK